MRRRSYADLLDPKWVGKIVKGHPGYSGAILTATFVLNRAISAGRIWKKTRPAKGAAGAIGRPTRRKKIPAGERAVMADGNDYNLVLLKDDGKPCGRQSTPSEGSAR